MPITLITDDLPCGVGHDKDTTPDYYKSLDNSGIECTDAQKAMCGEIPQALKGKARHGAKQIVPSPMAYYWRTAALKYLWRFDRKNGAEDLEKCIDCCIRLKKEIYG